MAPPHVLVLVLAGGAGSRLELLTERRAKPAVSLAKALVNGRPWDSTGPPAVWCC